MKTLLQRLAIACCALLLLWLCRDPSEPWPAPTAPIVVEDGDCRTTDPDAFWSFLDEEAADGHGARTLADVLEGRGREAEFTGHRTSACASTAT